MNIGELIASIGGDPTELKKSLESVKAEMSKASQSIKNENIKISNSFAKTGAQAKTGLQGATASTKGLGSSLLAMTGITVGLGSAWAIYHKALESTSRTSSGLAANMAAVNGVGQALLRTIANGEWHLFVQSLIDGSKGARQLNEALDQYNNALLANRLLAAEDRKELFKLEEIWKNTGSNSVRERAAALEEWATKRKQIAKRDLTTEQEVNNNLVSVFGKRTNLTKEQLRRLITVYSQYGPQIAKAGELYDDLRAVAQRAGAEGEWGVFKSLFKNISKSTTEAKQAFDDLDLVMKDTGISTKDLLGIIKASMRMSVKEINQLGESFIKVAEAEGAIEKIDADIAKTKGNLEKKLGKFDASGPFEKIQQRTFQNFLIKDGDIIKIFKPLIDGAAFAGERIKASIVGPIESLKLPIQQVQTAFEQFGGTVTAIGVKTAFSEIKQVIIDVSKELQYLSTDALTGLAEGIGTVLGGGSMKDALNSFLFTIADWASNLGKLMIAAGIATSAFWKSLTNPATAPLAIGLGAALVTAAAAVKTALSNNPVSGGGGSGGKYSGGGSDGQELRLNRQLQQFNVLVNGKIVAEGNTLAVILANENKRKNR